MRLGLWSLVSLLAVSACSSPEAADETALLGGEVPASVTDIRVDPPASEQPLEPSTSNVPLPGVAEVAAPTDLVALLGGATIAVRWSYDETVPLPARFLVFRDGVKLQEVTPGFHPMFPERRGLGIIDAREIVPGRTYRYEIQAVLEDGRASVLSAPLVTTQPRVTLAAPNIRIDFAEAPELEAYLRDTAVPFLHIWYPKLVLALAHPDYAPTPFFTIRLDKDYDGLAYAWQGEIVIQPQWLRDHPEDLGMFLHEATHLVQDYRHASLGWVTEGIADWTREYMLVDRKPTVLDATKHQYTQGYGVASTFLERIRAKYAPNFIRELNVESHLYGIDARTFELRFNKTVDDLWLELVGGVVPGPLAFAGAQNRCVRHAGVAQPLLVGSCLNTPQWVGALNADGTWTVRSGGDCLDVASSGVTAGTVVWAYTCNGTGAQKWVHQADGSLKSSLSDLCLSPRGGLLMEGATMEVAVCTGEAAQKFTFPGLRPQG